MHALPTTTTSRRLVALDAFRGITIAGMILVNNPGSWSHVYPPLQHARWHGWTPTDLVFPFFLFIVGVALAFSFRRRLEQPGARAAVLAQVVRRTLILFLLGLVMAGFPDFRLIGPYLLATAGLVLLFWDEPVLKFDASPGAIVRKVLGCTLIAGSVAFFAYDFSYFTEKHLRIPGVLQRIAVCYFCASLLLMTCGTRLRIAWTAALLVGYALILRYIQAPADYTADVTGSEGLLHDWLDVRVLGEHLYRERPDPEGLLSTLPAIATVLLGAFTGQWLQSDRPPAERAAGLFVAANVALLAGLCWDPWLPINKKIWTSSYVLLMAGLALHFLAVCYWLIDIRGVRRWAWPFVVFGSNAITVYVAASLTAKWLAITKMTAADGRETTIKNWIYQSVYQFLLPLSDSPDDPTALAYRVSLAYPLVYLLIWLVPMAVLHRRRIFVKV